MPKHRSIKPSTDRPRYDRAERLRVQARFRDAVNMSPQQIGEWLKTPESRSVGTVRSGVSVGRASARRILRILRVGASYSAADYAHMRKVAGYVARHLAQRPSGDLRRTRWRYSLMNWGHDPLGRGKV